MAACFADTTESSGGGEGGSAWEQRIAYFQSSLWVIGLPQGVGDDHRYRISCFFAICKLSTGGMKNCSESRSPGKIAAEKTPGWQGSI
jgi:hypothetical protein